MCKANTKRNHNILEILYGIHLLLSIQRVTHLNHECSKRASRCCKIKLGESTLALRGCCAKAREEPPCCKRRHRRRRRGRGSCFCCSGNDLFHRPRCLERQRLRRRIEKGVMPCESEASCLPEFVPEVTMRNDFPRYSKNE